MKYEKNIVGFKKTHPDAQTPTKAYSGDAGYDLYSLEDCGPASAGDLLRMRTGISLEIPEGCFGMLAPRSSTFSKYGFIIPNSVGIIDSGYRGELLIQAYVPVKMQRVSKGDRIAQIILIPFLQNTELADIKEDFSVTTERGSNGFGSSGNK